MVRRCATACAFVLLFASAVAYAQSAPGAGKVEVGFFPGGGLFFAGGDGNQEADFNVYTGGGWVSLYLTRIASIEGEASFGLGVSQDVHVANRVFTFAAVPHTTSFNGNIVLYPAGSDRLFAGYLTGGVGVLRLIDRGFGTAQYGFTKSESFFDGNFGGGLKILRPGTGLSRWGARIDYRILTVASKDDAIPFFARSKSRLGQRIYVGFLYTVTR